MGLCMKLAAIVLALGMSGACAADSPPLVTKAWPAPSPCDACYRVQFGQLEMELPRSLVGKLLVPGPGRAALNLVPAAGDAAHSPFLLMKTQQEVLHPAVGASLFDKVMSRYHVSNAADFYSLLGKPAGTDRELARVKQAKLPAAVRAYSRYANEKVEVFRIDATDPELSSAHFVVNGDNVVYVLHGPFEDGLFDAVLAHLEVVPVP